MLTTDPGEVFPAVEARRLTEFIEHHSNTELQPVPPHGADNIDDVRPQTGPTALTLLHFTFCISVSCSPWLVPWDTSRTNMFYSIFSPESFFIFSNEIFLSETVSCGLVSDPCTARRAAGDAEDVPVAVIVLSQLLTTSLDTTTVLFFTRRIHQTWNPVWFSI